MECCMLSDPWGLTTILSAWTSTHALRFSKRNEGLLEGGTVVDIWRKRKIGRFICWYSPRLRKYMFVFWQPVSCCCCLSFNGDFTALHWKLHACVYSVNPFSCTDVPRKTIQSNNRQNTISSRCRRIYISFFLQIVKTKPEVQTSSKPDQPKNEKQKIAKCSWQLVTFPTLTRWSIRSIFYKYLVILQAMHFSHVPSGTPNMDRNCGWTFCGGIPIERRSFLLMRQFSESSNQTMFFIKIGWQSWTLDSWQDDKETAFTVQEAVFMMDFQI